MTALAIADDQIAVSFIALFYNDRIHFIPLLLSAVGIVVCFVANVLGVRKPLLYAIVEVEGDQFARDPKRLSPYGSCVSGA